VRGHLRTGIAVTAAISAAVAVYVAATLPPTSIRLDHRRPPTHLLGGYHIHSNRSDGTGTVDEIAAEAARAGFAYIILTDHGDATRAPEAATYRHGVLVIDGVELNSREGHIVALGLREAAPYPLAGPARDVIADIHRLGGVAIVAHPDSPNAGLRWQGMNQGFDGIEWLNADSEWRDETTANLLGAAARALVRPAETIATLFARPTRSLQRWDNAARLRPVFAIAALDAHARIGWRDDEEPRRRTAFARPTYETMFRTLGQTTVVDTPLTGRAGEDADQILAALRAGRSYSIVRAFADPASLRFQAHSGTVTTQMGGRLSAPGAAVTFEADLDGAPGARLTLLRNGVPVAHGLGNLSSEGEVRPGVYRIEALLPGRAFPWIVSNAIVVEPAVGEALSRTSPPDPPAGERVAIPIAGARWTVEHDPVSGARLMNEPTRIGLTFTLSGASPHGQYAALVVGGHDDSGIDGIEFTGQSDQPMRVSVQVRLPGGRDGQRWRQSVYLDSSPRPIGLRLQDFEPIGPATSRRPIVAPLHSLLFVVDTVNSRPGVKGTFWISDLKLSVNRLTSEVRSAP
jgi:hypothetical protein